MDIGTAKITKEEMQGVKHYLVDEIEPTDGFDVARFKTMAVDAIQKIRENGHIPVVVGGTGFYIQALLYDSTFEDDESDYKYRDYLQGIAVKENGDDIVFLRKIVKGGADKSYGIQVAKLAGVPDVVLNRAKELVVDLSDADISQKAKDIAQYSKKLDKMNDKYRKVNDLEVKQMSLFDTVKDDDIVTDIMNLDISNMTPIDALNTLYKLQGKAKNRW
jgi:hypothetical protein